MMGESKLRSDGPGLEVVRSTERDYFKALGKRIKRLREQHELTQYDLARLLDVSQQTVFAYEGGHRRLRLDMVPTLMKALQVECEALLGLQPLASLAPLEARVSPPARRRNQPARERRSTHHLSIGRGAERLTLRASTHQPRCSRPGLFHARDLHCSMCAENIHHAANRAVIKRRAIRACIEARVVAMLMSAQRSWTGGSCDRGELNSERARSLCPMDMNSRLIASLL